MMNIKLKELIMKEAIYTGEIDSKMTSMPTNSPAPSLVKLSKTWPKEAVIIDYGCGQTARNAMFLRKEGFKKVYSFDPRWGTPNVNGFSGITSDRPDNKKFDIGFTSFVVNVVIVNDEIEILNWMNSHCKDEYHIVRCYDIKREIKTYLKKKNTKIIDFFKKEGFDMNQPLTDEFVEQLASYGYKTSKGFQRVPHLDETKYTMYRDGENKVYKKK